MRLIGLAVIYTIGLLAAPLAAEAQQAGKVYRIGVLHPGTSQTSSTEAFRQGLRELGYVEGQTLTIEWRWAAGKPERYFDLATDLVRSGVDVIVAAHTQTALAAKGATQNRPHAAITTLQRDPDRAAVVLEIDRGGTRLVQSHRVR
jgi:putative ABC transport system substrate-binding protein